MLREFARIPGRISQDIVPLRTDEQSAKWSTTFRNLNDLIGTMRPSFARFDRPAVTGKQNRLESFQVHRISD
jgi:hypothetical protein